MQHLCFHQKPGMKMPRNKSGHFLYSFNLNKPSFVVGLWSFVVSYFFETLTSILLFCALHSGLSFASHTG